MKMMMKENGIDELFCLLFRFRFFSQLRDNYMRTGEV